MKLTDTAIRKAKLAPGATIPRKMADGGGMYLEISPSGSKLWRLRYRRVDGKETTVSLGAYPRVTLAHARAARDHTKLRMKEQGIDPATERRADRLRAQQALGDSFEAVARHWLATKTPKWSAKRPAKVTRRLEVDAFPFLGSRPISEIKAPEIMQVLRRVESRTLYTAHRLKQEMSMIFRYAVQNGRAEIDPTAALRGALETHEPTHFAAITEPKAVGKLIRDLREYPGTAVVKAALRLAPLVFQRPGELRAAEWGQIDLDAAEWRYHVTKTKTDHIVPLSTQAVDVLRELHKLTGSGHLVFPGIRDLNQPMSENTVTKALRIMGYTGKEMTSHGFRAMARTLLAENGWKPDAIERQLAHKPSGPLGAAYDRAAFLPERRQMMQAWADYLDVLAAGNDKVVSIGKAA